MVDKSLGISRDAVHILATNILGNSKGWSDDMLLQALRLLSRDDATKELKKVPKGKLGNTSLRNVLDSLYSIPRVLVTSAQVRHTVEKGSGKAVGILHLELEVDQLSEHSGKRGTGGFPTCILVLGTSEQRMILAQNEFSISHSKRSISIEKQLSFDWDVANADGGEGGGSVVLRILYDSVRGMDSEINVKLR